ncbi:hypothetical protein JHK84_040498 [Glycine max]|nr:hypothetical protein JHK84_040498 [Glycine max]
MPPCPPSSTTSSSPLPSSGSPAPDSPSPSPTNSSSKPHRRTETPSFRTPSSPSTCTRGSVTMPCHSPSTTTLWCSSSSPTSSARTSPPPTTSRVFVRKKAITFVLSVFNKYPDAVRVLIVSYETFQTHSSKFSSTYSCELLICDEAHRLKNDQTITNWGKSCMLVAGDVYKPAAIDQLAILGKHVDVPVYTAGTDVKPSEIAKQGLEEAKKKKIDVVIVDTTALVTTFNPEIGITGAILTKLDADSRGGAALSFREVLDPEVAVNKEEYQVFDELGRGRFGTMFRCFQHRGLRRHQNGGLGVVGEEVAECVDPAKKKELDGLCAEMPVALAECVEIAKLFPNLFGQPSTALVPSDSHTPPVNQKLKIGVVLSGGQAPGGHNVISGIFDYLQDLVEGSTLYGFRGGPTGIMKCKYVELTSDYIYPYRNQRCMTPGQVGSESRNRRPVDFQLWVELMG